MAESTVPLSPDRIITDWDYEQLISGYAPSGILGSPGDTTVCVADGLGMYVIVRLGKYALVRGFKWYSGTSNFNKTIAANSSGNPRIDLVVLRLTRSTWRVTTEVVQGIPAASPVVPALTQDLGSSGVFEIPLAEVTVASGATAIAGGNCVAKDYYLSRIPLVGLAANLPPSGTRIDQTYRASNTGIEYKWNGSLWIQRDPSAAFVATSQGTSSTSYTDLATVGPSVSMVTGTSVLVILSTSAMCSVADGVYAGVAVSGASTIAADTSKAFQMTGTTLMKGTYSFPLTVTAGSNTFTMKYRAAFSGTATFADRSLAIIPLS
jgi:hypothetical protein